MGLTYYTLMILSVNLSAYFTYDLTEDKMATLWVCHASNYT